MFITYNNSIVADNVGLCWIINSVILPFIRCVCLTDVFNQMIWKLKSNKLYTVIFNIPCDIHVVLCAVIFTYNLPISFSSLVTLKDVAIIIMTIVIAITKQRLQQIVIIFSFFNKTGCSDTFSISSFLPSFKYEFLWEMVLILTLSILIWIWYWISINDTNFLVLRLLHIQIILFVELFYLVEHTYWIRNIKYELRKKTQNTFEDNYHKL